MERPPLYPIFLDLAFKDVLVVGAGQVALRKTREFLKHGAKVRVISPTFAPEFADLPIERIERPWKAGDERRARLVIAATSNPVVNREVFANASQQRILCDVVDQPELSDFHPATIEQDSAIQVGFQTGGLATAVSWACRKLGKGRAE